MLALLANSFISIGRHCQKNGFYVPVQRASVQPATVESSTTPTTSTTSEGGDESDWGAEEPDPDDDVWDEGGYSQWETCA